MLPQYHPSVEAQLAPLVKNCTEPPHTLTFPPKPNTFLSIFLLIQMFLDLYVWCVYMAHIWGCVWIVVLFTYVWILVSLNTYRSMSLMSNNDIASKVKVKVIFDRIQTSKNWIFTSKNIHMPLWLLMEHKYKYTCNTPGRLTQQKTPDTMVTYLTLLSSLNVMFVH